MKYLTLLFLLPGLVLAEPADDQKEAPSFEQFKSAMQSVIGGSLPAMEKTRACVSQAGTQADVEQCMKKMAKMAQDVQQSLGMPKGVAPEDIEMGKPPKDFEWNEETKAEMLKHMDLSIQQSASMKACLDKSSTGEEMNSCMKSKMPGQKKPKATQ